MMGNKDTELDFSVFKAQFLLALPKVNITCQGFILAITNAKDIIGMRNVFKRYGEEIAEWNGVDLNKECRECVYMERELANMKEKLEPYKDIQSSVADEYKFKAFAKHKNDFSSDELETLFYNGKTLLEMLNKTDKWEKK